MNMNNLKKTLRELEKIYEHKIILIKESLLQFKKKKKL